MEERERPGFSIIIPVYHGGEFLKRALKSALKLDASPGSTEVLVAGRREDEEAAAIVAEAASGAPFALRYLGADDSGRASFLNAACREARGDVLAFADDDCVLRPDWLARWRAILEESPVPALVGGSDELEPGASAFSLALEEVLHSPFITGSFPTTGPAPSARGHPRLFNMALPRRLALDAALAGPDGTVQVFDESLPGHEDLDLARRVERAGARVSLFPEVRVGHFRDTTWRGMLNWNFGLARAARALGVRIGPHLLLVGYFAGVIGFAAGALVWPPAAAALAALAAVYLLPVLAWAVFSGTRRRRFSTALLFPALLVPLHVARVAGYLTGRPRRS